LEIFMLNRRLFMGLLAAGVFASIAPGIVQARDTPVANKVALVHGPDVIAGLILEAAQR
jgi:hypothetical protein